MSMRGFICRKVESALHAELKALLFGLEVTRRYFSKSLIIESDSLLAIKEVSKKIESFCSWSSIILDITEISLGYGSCNFNFVRRDANHLAHNVAKLNCDRRAEMIWKDSFPSNICNLDSFNC